MRLRSITICISLFVLVSFSFIISNCSKNIIESKKVINKSDGNEILVLLKKITEINNNSPRAFSVTFTLKGIIDGKKFKTLGSGIYNKSPKKMRITVKDVVFNSALSIVIVDNEIIKFYIPVEKKLYIDNEKTIDLKNYINLNINYKIFYSLVTGMIPILSNYRIKEGLTTKRDSPPRLFLILENDDYFETISFRENIPDKILFINKSTKEKFEIYLEKPLYIANTLYYKRIKFIFLETDCKLSLKFNNIKSNIQIKLKNITRLKLEKDTRIMVVK